MQWGLIAKEAAWFSPGWWERWSLHSPSHWCSCLLKQGPHCQFHNESFDDVTNVDKTALFEVDLHICILFCCQSMISNSLEDSEARKGWRKKGKLLLIVHHVTYQPSQLHQMRNTDWRCICFYWMASKEGSPCGFRCRTLLACLTSCMVLVMQEVDKVWEGGGMAKGLLLTISSHFWPTGQALFWLGSCRSRPLDSSVWDAASTYSIRTILRCCWEAIMRKKWCYQQTIPQLQRMTKKYPPPKQLAQRVGWDNPFVTYKSYTAVARAFKKTCSNAFCDPKWWEDGFRFVIQEAKEKGMVQPTQAGCWQLALMVCGTTTACWIC